MPAPSPPSVSTPLLGQLNWRSYQNNPGLSSWSNVFTAANGKLYAFYGANTLDNGELNWLNALAYADNIDGPWMRDISKNDPDFIYAENPFIYKYDGVYFCVYDDLSNQHSIGYGYSTDGVHWVRKTMDLNGHTPWVHQNWYVQSLRTPCSLIKEENGTYTIIFTGYQAETDYFGIGKISVRIDAKELVQNATSESFPADNPAWHPNSGTWQAQCGEYCQRAKEDTNYNSVIAGCIWDNFIVETDLRCVDSNEGTWGGIQIRKTNAADGPTDSGYLVRLSAEGVISLYVHDTKLAEYDSGYPAYVFKHLRVLASRQHIYVYYDGSAQPCIEVKDSTFAKGYISLNVSKSHWRFNNVTVDRDLKPASL